jgi:Flp pilus assembly pilin Flp
MSDLLMQVWAAVHSRVLAIREGEEGQTLVEYALIIALVSIGCITALGLLTSALNGIFGTITSALNGA